MTTIRFKLPKIHQVEFTIECMPEDLQVKGNASAIDDETDREIEQYIYDELNNGNEWAWCCITISAHYKGQIGSASLGGCSYKNKTDFKENSGYYEDMKQSAFDDLISSLERLRD
jgi:hypothetical protein